MPEDPQPQTTAIVPNVIGESYPDAKGHIDGAGFVTKLDGSSSGTVRTEKDPNGRDAADQRLEVGTSITLTMTGVLPM